MYVPFHRVKLGDAEIDAAVRVLRSGWLTTGDETSHFESEFAKCIGEGVEAVAVNSNTAGLHLALEALGIKKGDEVIVPTLTFTATAEVVRYLDAEPILADVDPNTLCITPETIEKKITNRTRAIIPVHFGGLSCDLTNIHKLAVRYGLFVVEDAAHAYPATHNGIKIGDHGSAATVFSFYANKTMTTGEGGMIVSNRPEILRRSRLMRLHGIDRDAFRRFTNAPSEWRYDVLAPGYKYNLTDIASAIGRQQLISAETLYYNRAAIAKRYDDAFAQLPVVFPAKPPPGDIHSHHLYVIQILDDAPLRREGLMAHLAAREVGYSIHYTPLHRLTYWRDRYGHVDSDFPVASQYAKRCISLPLFPSMTTEEVDCVIEAVVSALN